MTLLMMEGFEARLSRYGWTHNAFSIAGRFGGICAHSGSVTAYLPVRPQETVVGFAYKADAAQNVNILSFYNLSFTSNENMRLERRSDNTLSIHRRDPGSTINATPIAISSGPVLQNGAWHYIEVRQRSAVVGGYFDVRVDGVPVVSYVGDTSPKYPNNGTDHSVTHMTWTGLASSINVDDIYICDRLGTEHNDFLGEIQVEGLFPNGNGAFSQWTGSDGNSVDNYLLVDESPASETDLVQSDVVGAKDTYQFTNLAMAAGQILAVQPTIYLSKANAGPAAAKTVERLANGVERKSNSYPALNMMPFSPLPQTRDPEGAVWTVESVNASQFGAEVA